MIYHIYFIILSNLDSPSNRPKGSTIYGIPGKFQPSEVRRIDNHNVKIFNRTRIKQTSMLLIIALLLHNIKQMLLLNQTWRLKFGKDTG